MGIFRKATDKATESTQKLSQKVSETKDRLTGKAVEDKLDEYSEVYGEVLLGMHRDIQAQRTLIHDYRDEMSSFLNEARSVASQLKHRNNEIARAYWIGICAAVIAVIAIGISIWTIAYLR